MRDSPFPLTFTGILRDGAAVNNTVGFVSGLVRWTAKHGTELIVPTDILPNLHLYVTAGVEPGGDLQIHLQKTVPGSPVPRPLGWFEYAAFVGQATDVQNNKDNEESFRQYLTAGLPADDFTIHGGESLDMRLYSATDVVDFSLSGTTIKFPVLQRILA